MGKNSIRDNLDKGDVISSIRLLLGADTRKEQVFLVVEGRSDVSFLNNYVRENVVVFASQCGKSGVESIVGESFAENDRVIGVRDRDYQAGPVSPKIFYYDGCCMEMMVFKSDGVFRKLCAEYFVDDVPFSELRRCVLRQLKCVSVARKLNEEKNWGITIRGYSIGAFWDNKARCVSSGIFLDKLATMKMNRELLSEEMQEEIREGCDEEWDEDGYFRNTQGHDFSELLALVCRKYGKAKNDVKGEEIERNGRFAYTEEDFAGSELCRELNEYGKFHGVRICAVSASE